MTENNIKVINTSYHKKVTNNHLAQVNFTALLPEELAQMYFNKTSIDHESLGRIRFIQNMSGDVTTPEGTRLVFGRVSHGYGYGIEQDIFNSIMDSKGVKK